MKIHATTYDTSGNCRVIMHSAVPTGNNAVGNSWKNVLIAAGRKTEVSAAFPPPFIGHEIQIIPSGPCRIWYDEIRWGFDSYPELIPAYTPIFEISGPEAKYMQGLRLTADSANLPVQFQILYDGGQLGPMLPAMTYNGKQTQVYTFPPFVAHNLQLVPQSAARIFLDECQWVYEPTPDLAFQWGPTQATSHGLNGYQHIQRLDAAYSSTSAVTLTITAIGGISPTVITLPSTGGAYTKVRITLTPNKSRAWTYYAVSTSKFQVFLNDFIPWVKQWGTDGPYQPCRILGDVLGDKARL